MVFSCLHRLGLMLIVLCLALLGSPVCAEEKSWYVPSGLLWTYTDNPWDRTAVPGEHLFVLFPDGDLVFYNFTNPHPVIELAPRPLKFKVGSWSGNVGPFGQWDTTIDEPVWYGLEAVSKAKFGRAVLKGPIYLYRTADHYGFFTPNVRLLYALNDRAAFGGAATVKVEQTLDTAVLFGPALEVKAGKTVVWQFRYGQWLKGAAKGDRQIRADLVIGF